MNPFRSFRWSRVSDHFLKSIDGQFPGFMAAKSLIDHSSQFSNIARERIGGKQGKKFLRWHGLGLAQFQSCLLQEEFDQERYVIPTLTKRGKMDQM